MSLFVDKKGLKGFI